MTSPKDYSEKAIPMPVADKEAENWLKGSNIIAGMILMVVSTGIGGAAWIGNHFVNELSSFKDDVNNGLRRLGNSVDDVGDKITILNVSTAVLSVKVNNVENRVTIIEAELRK